MNPTQQPNVFARQPSLLAALGAGLMGLGVLFEFLLEHLENTQNFEFSFLDHVSFPALAIGILLLCIGGVMWGRRASPAKVAIYGAVIAVLAFAGGWLTPINIHGWTASLMFVYTAIAILGIVLLFVAAARHAPSRHA